jgi:hypothetical protein
MSVRLYAGPRRDTGHRPRADGQPARVRADGVDAADRRQLGRDGGGYGMVVALPDAPGGGVVLGCWDYYDGNHSRTSPARHDDNLLALVSALTDRTSLGIDRRRCISRACPPGAARPW